MEKSNFIDPSVRTDLNVESAREKFEIQSTIKKAGTTFGSIVAVTLLALVILSFGFIVRSLWNFTHPSFDFTVPNLPSLSAISHGQGGDATKQTPGSSSSPLPNVQPQNRNFSDASIKAYLDKVHAQINPIAGALTGQELVDIGANICKGVDKGYSSDNIISGFTAKISSEFPNVPGVTNFGKTILDSAKQNLCKSTAQVP